jgi:hypothetical protein
MKLDLAFHGVFALHSELPTAQRAALSATTSVIARSALGDEAISTVL